MRFARFFPAVVFVAFAAAVAVFPQSEAPGQWIPGTRKPLADPQPPMIVLPPDELVPLQVFRTQDAAAVDWGVAKLKAPEAWTTTKGKGVLVAVLDTGCDTSHPDLSAGVKSAKDFTGSPYGASDKQGHGTHVSGSVLARGPLPGCAPEASLLVGKVLNDQGAGSVVWIANGIRWATENGADVISMSLGGPQSDSYIPPALVEADAAGVIVVAAAGNDGPNPNTCGYPGRYTQCNAVAAVDINLKTAGFSSRCSEVYIAGPGVNVRSTYPGGQYATMSGTSMATPNIAGVAALWVAAHPEIPKKDRPKKFREALQAAALDLDPAGRDTATGYGFPDATKLVAGGSQPSPPNPNPPGPCPPCPMPPGATVVIGVDDLTPSAVRKLLDVSKGGSVKLDVQFKW